MDLSWRFSEILGCMKNSGNHFHQEVRFRSIDWVNGLRIRDGCVFKENSPERKKLSYRDFDSINSPHISLVDWRYRENTAQKPLTRLCDIYNTAEIIQCLRLFF